MGLRKNLLLEYQTSLNEKQVFIDHDFLVGVEVRKTILKQFEDVLYLPQTTTSWRSLIKGKMDGGEELAEVVTRHESTEGIGSGERILLPALLDVMPIHERHKHQES